MTSERRVDAHRALVCAYLLFVVAAGARGAVQLATHASRAPLAYTLSALAALTYLAGAVLLIRRRTGPAMVCCAVEFLGVLVVGTASVVAPQAFPDATVWSAYGQGYGYVPLALPLLAIAWLHRRRRQEPR